MNKTAYIAPHAELIRVKSEGLLHVATFYNSGSDGGEGQHGVGSETDPDLVDPEAKPDPWGAIGGGSIWDD